MKFRKVSDYSHFNMMIHRAQQCAAALEIAQLLSQGHRRIALSAPVKSGKKEIMIAARNIMADASYCSKKSGRVFIAVTSLNRRDTSEQHALLNDCQIKSVRLQRREREAWQVISEIESLVAEGKEVILFIDESDYGTSYRQMLSDIYKAVRDNDLVTVIGISATNYELEFAKGGCPVVQFTPAKTYRGGEWFLSSDLVEEATSFLLDDGSYLSNQGHNVLQGLMESDKFFVVVRLRSNYQFFRQEHKRILSKHFPDLKVIFADGTSPFDWSPDATGHWHGYVSCGVKTLIVINQTCTRSTEVGFHKHIYAWHDYYDVNTTALSTALQAILRVAHYDDSGHRIRLFCHVNDLRIEAGLIPKGDRYLSPRVKTTEATKDDGEVLKFWFQSKPSVDEVAKAFNATCVETGVQFKVRRVKEGEKPNFSPKFANTIARHKDEGNMSQSYLNDAVRSTDRDGGLAGIHFNGTSDPNHTAAYSEVEKQTNGFSQGNYVVLIPVIDPRKEERIANMPDKEKFQTSAKSMFN